MSSLASSDLYPLLFDPALHTKPWGGYQMSARLGKQIASGEKVGESWEIYYRNTVSNGSLAGRTLADLIAEFPDAMTGRADADPEFPLLVKFLDPAEWLSVQVHPDDALAAELEGQPRGKTECWYVIQADPDAKIAYGLAEPLDAESMRERILSGQAESMMQYVPVAPGDFIYMQAGTMHALGPGALIYELQQTSDTTYRVYDWGRVGLDGKPRDLHLDKALRCAHFDVNPVAQVTYSMNTIAPGVQHGQLVRGQYFTLDKYLLAEAADIRTDALTIETEGQAHLISAITNHIELRTGDDDNRVITLLPQGTSAFIPAGIESYTVVSDGEAEILIAHE